MSMVTPGGPVGHCILLESPQDQPGAGRTLSPSPWPTLQAVTVAHTFTWREPFSHYEYVHLDWAQGAVGERLAPYLGHFAGVASGDQAAPPSAAVP